MIRILVVDDQAVVRAGLAVILGAEADIEVVGQAADGDEAVARTRELRPDVVCMDIRMPGTDGIAATRAITADPGNAAEVLILTTFDLDEDVFAALDAGAAGFLLKGADEQTLRSAVRSVAAGEGTLDSRLTRRIVHEFTQRRTASATHASVDVDVLTEREREVLKLVAEGLSNAQIGARLFVEHTTVKYHLAQILQKTATRDRLQAVLWGIRAGLVEVR